MASAAELLVPLRAGLVPVPQAGEEGVCRVCLSGCDPQYDQCYPCLQALRTFGPLEVLPISMSVDSELLHRHLRGYKDDRSEPVRARMSTRLAALLAVFLGHHADCVRAYDSIALVPSPERTAMESVISRLPSLRERYVPALEATGAGAKSDLLASRFRVTRDVHTESVLLLDDTFTRGPSLFSAVGALRDAGAEVVGPVVLGRHVQPGWEPSRVMLSWLRSREWDDTRCARCNGERADPERLF